MKGRKLLQWTRRPYNHELPPSEENYGAYGWQRDFFSAGRTNPERCLIAANRTGKTMSAAAEMSIHLTGNYPDWWEGRRFNEPVRAWTGSNTNESSRDIIQNALLGDEGQHGTGWLPKDSIKHVGYRQAGVPQVVDTIKVKYKGGGQSSVTLKTYDQGFQKWMGTSRHIVWLDEECPLNIYTESMTRILDVKGILLLTFTPLLGTTDVVEHFRHGGPGIFMKNVSWDDAPHLDPDEKIRLANSYPAWERETRTKGIPMLGSGAVYPIRDEEIMIPPFEIPPHYYRLCGIDFGIDHPAAAVWIAWNKDTDVIYVYDCYKKEGQTPPYHADAIKSRGSWIPVAWPHDGITRDKGTADPLYKQYKNKGVKMLRRHARYDEKIGGTQGVEPAIIDILERMQTGRFKVFSTLGTWFEEKRMYHRKDGIVVPKRDDIMAATRIVIMDKRKAQVQTIARTKRPIRHTILGGLHGR